MKYSEDTHETKSNEHFSKSLKIRNNSYSKWFGLPENDTE